MKKFIVVCVFLVLALGTGIGVFFMRDGLARLPWAKAEAFDFPEAAFSRADGSCVVFDSRGTRMLSVDRDANLQWSVSSGDIYGKFLSADMDSSGMLYIMDQQPAGEGPFHFERIMRVSPDGAPGGLLLQSRVQGKAGFVPGSLRVSGDALWYLVAGEDGLVSAMRMNLKDAGKQAIVKTEWSLSRAVLAADGPEGALVVNAGGGLVRFVRGRFEALAELGGPLPYPVDVRYDKDGNLLVADAARGVIAKVGADGTATVLATQKDAASLSSHNPAASPAPLDYILSLARIAPLPARLSVASRIDAFSTRGAGFVSVDRMNGKVVFFDAKGSAKRLLTGAALSDLAVRACLVAWILAGSCVVFLVLFLVSLNVVLVTAAPRPLAMVFAALPGAFLALAVVMIVVVHANAASVAASDALSLGELRGMAAAGATAFDGEKLTPVENAFKRAEADSNELQQKVKALQSAAEGKSADARLTPDVSLYSVSGNGLLAICDSAGLYPLNFPQRLVPDSYLRAILAGETYAGSVAGPSGSWNIAAAPIKNGAGAIVAVLEFSSQAARVPVGFVVASAIGDNVKYLLLVSLGLVLATLGALLTATLRGESKLRFVERKEPDVFAGMKTDDGYSLDSGFDGASGALEMKTDSAERFEPDFDDSGIRDGKLDTDLGDEIGLEDDMAGIIDIALYDFPDLEELPGEFEPKAGAIPEPVPPAASNFPQAKPIPAKSAKATSAEGPGAAVKIAPFAIPSVQHQKLHREAIAALNSGDVDAAVVILERILDEDPKDSRALNNLGVACKRQGRLSLAIEYLEKSLALEPGNEDTKANLERLRKVT